MSQVASSCVAAMSMKPVCRSGRKDTRPGGFEPVPERNRESGVFGCEGERCMRRYLFLGTSMLAGMILLAGCNQNQNTSANGANPAASDLAPASQPDAETAQNAAPGGSVPAAPGQLSTATQTFLQDIALEDMYQVQAGQIAAMRSQSPDIKQYAQQMVDMRTQNLNMLKQLIGNRAPDYKPPTQLDQLHQALLDDLQ